MQTIIVKRRVSMEHLVSELVISGYTVTVSQVRKRDKETNTVIHPFEIKYERNNDAAV